jgi:hypothetical protein
MLKILQKILCSSGLLPIQYYTTVISTFDDSTNTFLQRRSFIPFALMEVALPPNGRVRTVLPKIFFYRLHPSTRAYGSRSGQTVFVIIALFEGKNVGY